MPKRQAGEHSQTIKRVPSNVRMLQVSKRVWYKPSTWRHRPPVPVYKSLPKARKLFGTALRQLWAHKGLFGGIIVIYGLLSIVLVQSLSGSSNLNSIKTALDSSFHGVGGKVVTSIASFGYLVASSGSGNTDTSGLYQALLLILCSLALIWALRQTAAQHKVRVRDSFYRGMYPLVPFFLVFLLLSVQLLPAAAGGGLYAIVINNGIAVSLWEKAFWLLLFIVLALWSLRMIIASLLALYIVTLPDMTPLRAHRNARQLVYGRRLLIWRKLIFLPVALVIVAAIIELPLIFFWTSAATWAFFVISMIALPLAHSYLYNLYRSML